MDRRDKDKDRDKKSEFTDEETSGKWGEMLRKVMSVGLGAAFMTEESIRSAVTELKLPKEVLSSILQSASRSKEEFVNRVGNETIKLISKIDFVKEASRFVEEHKFKIQAEIEVVKKQNADESSLNLKSNVKIRD
jgi:hypothetical protein